MTVRQTDWLLHVMACHLFRDINMTLLMNCGRHVIWNVHFVFFQAGIAFNRDSGVSLYNSISHLHPMSSNEQSVFEVNASFLRVFCVMLMPWKLICFRIAVSALLPCLLLKWKPTFPSQLTAVKVEHPLTSSGWSYRKLRCTAHRFEVFLEEFPSTKHVDYINNPKGSSLTLFRPYPSINSKPFMIRPLILHKIMYLSFPTFKRSLINKMT